MRLSSITLTPRDIRRFWKFGRSGLKSECWLWNGGLNKDGYGSFRFRERCWGAHRVAFKMMIGEVRDDLEVCHTCDNPRCINPYHLFQGTHAKNIKDGYDKGRVTLPPRQGSANGQAKLTESQVLYIFNSDHLQHDLAVEFNVGQGTISRIKCGLRWGHLTGKVND